MQLTETQLKQILLTIRLDYPELWFVQEQAGQLSFNGIIHGVTLFTAPESEVLEQNRQLQYLVQDAVSQDVTLQKPFE